MICTRCLQGYEKNKRFRPEWISPEDDRKTVVMMLLIPDIQLINLCDDCLEEFLSWLGAYQAL